MVTRRSFLRATSFTALSYSRILGANDSVRLGVIGTGSRGQYVTGQFVKTNRVRVTALCDVYAGRLDEAQSKLPAGARGFSDHRKLLESGETDAVLIATPDHWHAVHAIDAMNAGKDIYCEKPLTLRIEEGPEIVKAARVNNRICQVGTQRRSDVNYIRAKQEFFDSGKLGALTMGRTWWHGNTAHLRAAPAALHQQPSNLDWARFLGPLKWRDWDPQQYANWRAYLDFGGGQVTDLFTHLIDMVQYFTGLDIPTSAVAAGGVYHYKDGRTAPDTVNVLLEYGDKLNATFDATLAPGMRGVGIEIGGTHGRLLIEGGKFLFQGPERDSPVEPMPTENRDSVLDHVANFLDCVQSRKLPNADVLIGHRSAQASHLGNIAYLQKRRLKFDPVREEILPL